MGLHLNIGKLIEDIIAIDTATDSGVIQSVHPHSGFIYLSLVRLGISLCFRSYRHRESILKYNSRT
jgi:hypothetical protein